MCQFLYPLKLSNLHPRCLKYDLGSKLAHWVILRNMRPYKTEKNKQNLGKICFVKYFDIGNKAHHICFLPYQKEISW